MLNVYSGHVDLLVFTLKVILTQAEPPELLILSVIPAELQQRHPHWPFQTSSWSLLTESSLVCVSTADSEDRQETGCNWEEVKRRTEIAMT